MSEALVCIGLNHRTAPVHVRERLAFPTESLAASLQALTSLPGASEAVLISTCNRVELYMVGNSPSASLFSQEAAKKLCELRGLSHDTVAPVLYYHADADCVRHLIRVASSLDSLVLGEPQILGQVKEAFTQARDAGTVGSMLNRVFDRAFKAAKRIRTETGIARNSVSVGTVAVDLAKHIFAKLEDCRVLVVGAGKMGTLAARHLANSGAGRVWVTNRSFEKAQKLADMHGWEAHALSDLPQLLTQVDIVISSTGATQPVFTKELIAPLLPKRKYRPLFLIDIAVPRDVDPAVAKIDNVFVYDIDDLESVTRKAVESRSKDVAKAVELVDVEVQQHLKWAQNLSVTPTIAALRKRSMDLVSSEAERLSHHDDALRQQLERYGQALINKLLHEPSVAMKDPHDGARLADSARKLFNLADLMVLDGERGTEAPAADEPPERRQA